MVRTNFIFILISSSDTNLLGKKSVKQTSSPKGNDAHLRAIIQSEKKWKHQSFRRLRAANSVVRGWIWPNFKLIQALMYVINTCKAVSMKRIPSRTIKKKGQHSFSNYNTICCHGNQWLDLAEFRTHPSFYACPHCLQVWKGSDVK